MCAKSVLRVLVGASLVFAMLNTVPPSPAHAQGAFLAGAAKAKITPKGPVWLAGYEGNRRSVGVHDDLWARALVLKSGEQLLAIASVDLLGFPNIYVQRVREMVSAVPDDAILVAATHDHSAPDVIGLWGPTPRQSGVHAGYVDFVIETVAQVIEHAAGNLAPASVRYASAGLPGVSKNVNVAEILDTELAALQAIGEDEKPIATLVNFACHPEIMHNNYVTADFPNWVHQRIEEQAGGVALFVNGALGGMVTADIEDIYDKGKDNWEDAARIGAAVADTALEVLAAAQPIDDPPIELRTSPLLVPLENPRFEAGIEAGVLPDFLENGQIRTEVVTGVIGRAQFVTIPGEAFPNIGLLLKRWMTGDVRFVFGLTQDELGYIMSREDYGLSLYDYETSMSIGSEMGYRLVEAVRPMIAEVNPGSRAAVGSLDAWFMGLPASFDADAAREVNAVYHFRVTGNGGGDYTITVRAGKCKVHRGESENADVTVTIAADDMSAIMADDLDPTAAFMTGKLVIDGDMELALKMVDVFDL